RTSCPPVPLPVFSLASLLTHPGGGSTTSPRGVFCPLRMSRSTSRCRTTVSFPTALPLPPPPPLFLAPGPPLEDPLPPQGPAPSGVSQVDPAEPVKVAVDSGAARGAETGGAESRGAESGGTETGRTEPGVVAPEGTVSGGGEPARAASGGALGVAAGAGAAGAGAAGGAAGTTWATGGAGAAGGGAGAGAAGAVGATGGAGAAGGGAGAGAAGGAARAHGGAGSAGGAAGAAGGTGAGAVSGGAARPRPYFVPLLQQVLGPPPSPGPPPPPFLSPPPVQSQSQLQPASPLRGPSPYSGPTRGLTERREPESRPVSPESRPASPIHTVRAGRGLRPRLPPVPGTHSMTLAAAVLLSSSCEAEIYAGAMAAQELR
ncbi:unnamed protein product, partial [Closterium sp. NIES-54]